ncbi:MAG: aryl-sulfate sulfotransferase [Dehalococcoidia bacterium]|nr:aryl-sulfate sulfotransferase [Dehalococcoidia bacterium]
MTLAERRVSRRSFIRGSAAGAGLIGAASVFGGTACRGTQAQPATATVPQPSATPIAYRGLRSRPDLNGAPALRVATSTQAASTGTYLLLTPLGGSKQGPAIFDRQGRLIWFQPAQKSDAADLHVVRYQGADALAWWEGDVTKTGYGTGTHLVYNDRYQEVARIAGVGGVPVDLHELVLTPQGTALVESYAPKTADLTKLGGGANAPILDCSVQELDLATGRLLFDWNASDHVGFAESVVPLPKDGGPFDYFHINAVEVDTDDNLLISARNTAAIYKVHRKTGQVIWRLGGSPKVKLPAPALALAPSGESFWYQHDIRRNPDGSLSLFDNGGGPYVHDGRGIVLDIDEQALTARVRRTYGDGLKLRIQYQGSFRRQANGNWLVGWGDLGRMTELTPNGDVALDVSFTGNSYRALSAAWRGRPADAPAVAAQRSGSGAIVWASWNGATDVDSWRVLGGADASSLTALGSFPWRDFETQMSVSGAAAIVAVEAVDASGQVLGRSLPVSAA